MLGLLGKKLGVTRLIDEKGNMVHVTVMKAGPCTVVQKKTKGSEGYDAVQLGFEEETKIQRVNKPMQGHFAKSKTSVFKYLTEFRPANIDKFNVGQVITVKGFKKGDDVKVQGTTKGRGFQGVMRRHGKHGGPQTHGSHFHRSTGSIGMRAWPGKVLKNTRLPGHMGNDLRTVKGLKIIDVDEIENLLFISGSVPGARNCLIKVFNISKDFEGRFA